MSKTNVFLMLVLLFLLAGCAGAQSEEETANPISFPDACSLLNAADIAEAIGTAAPLDGAGELDEENGVSSCEWTFPEEIPGSLSVTIWTRKENGTAAQQSIFIRGQVGLTDGKDDHVVPVSGLGDEAYFRFDNITSFWWRMDDDYVIHLYVSDYPIGWEAFYDLALQVDRSEVIS